MQPEDKLGKLLSYLVAISTIIGIPAGLYSYMSSAHAKKVERTYEYYRDYRSESFQKDWMILIDHWNEKAAEAQKFLDLKDFDAIAKLAIAIADKDEHSKRAFARSINFFDEAYACVESVLCDHNAAVVLLQKPTSDFVNIFGSYVMIIRKEYKNNKYASGAFRIKSLEKRFSIF